MNEIENLNELLDLLEETQLKHIMVKTRITQPILAKELWVSTSWVNKVLKWHIKPNKKLIKYYIKLIKEIKWLI